MKLVILDDYFPNILTGFRIAEYNYYLNTFPEAKVITSCNDYNRCFSEYKTFFPENSLRIEQFNKSHFKNLDVDVFYTVFISNIYNYISLIEKYNKPFIFCLYPGGGLLYNNNQCIQKLRRVFASNCFRKVIVTQKSIKEFLISKRLVPENKISFIYGGPMMLKIENKEKKLYKKHKDTFDICFVAHKYMDGGIDKGYDLFIESCKKLSDLDNDIRFHVVGGCTEKDADISKIKDKVKFYGLNPHDFFPEFYSNMDIILSPNRANILAKGAFDGFPTGCCIQAGLNGVAVFCTDPLNENIYFQDGKDICLIDYDINRTTEKILYYKNNIDELYEISKNTKENFQKIFDLDEQMKERIISLEKTLEGGANANINLRRRFRGWS